jgi:2-dehydro-3-deoxygluconokinase
MIARVLTFGETMGLATNDQAGTLTTSRSCTMSFGGAESNVAIALTRLGTPVTWVSRLGTDPFADLIRRELRAEGVDVVAAADPLHPTGFMLKERRTASIGSVTFWRSGSAASRITPDAISDELIAGADLVHITGIPFALSSTARATAFDLLDRAKQLGTPISFDVNHRERLRPASHAAEDYRAVIPYCTVVFAGDDEAAILVGDGTPAELADRLCRLGARDAVIKLGGDGCSARIDGSIYQLAARKVDVVDTVGAGDAFVAGYLSELVAGRDASSRLETAISAGAFACTSLGDWEGSPTRADLALLDAREGIAR